MHVNCPVCKSEGFEALTRVEVKKDDRSIVATLNVVESDILATDEASLSTEAMKRLGVKNGDPIVIKHLEPVNSLSFVRGKMFGKKIHGEQFNAILKDIVAGKYSNIELAAFISACSGNRLEISEIADLTKAMISTGQRMHWEWDIVLDKHSIGGIPGNRTTPVIVPIVAAAGLFIPKTSSRAITSPAGTADTMETLTNVRLGLDEIREIVKTRHGCLVWGGFVNLSPADDILISVERALDVDSEGQMVASVLSKKAAAGSTHVVIDIPWGPTAKVRTHEDALRLQFVFKAVGEALKLQVEAVISDGSQPVGRGIGPALEAIDVLKVLRNDPDLPLDLKERALELSSNLLALSGKFSLDAAKIESRRILESGEALVKFLQICEAQGAVKNPVTGKYTYEYCSGFNGVVRYIDNRKLARIAKLAGAPESPGAGVEFFAPLGRKVSSGDLLFRIYAEVEGELRYAREFLERAGEIIRIESE